MCRLPAELFGEAVVVLEFLHSFGPLFNIREVIREGITFGEWGTREISEWGRRGRRGRRGVNKATESSELSGIR